MREQTVREAAVYLQRLEFHTSWGFPAGVVLGLFGVALLVVAVSRWIWVRTERVDATITAFVGGLCAVIVGALLLIPPTPLVGSSQISGCLIQSGPVSAETIRMCVRDNPETSSWESNPRLDSDFVWAAVADSPHATEIAVRQTRQIDGQTPN